MEDIRVTILKDSNKIISKLQILSVFFEDEIVYKIYLRTQVIHQLFEGNAELDIHKLELFHVQFTETVIALLKKIKKNNEKNVSLMFHEIDLNKDLMERLDDSVFTVKNFNLDKQKQALKINTTLRKLYQVLSEDSQDYPFSKNINAFNSRFSQDFFFDISPDLLMELIQYDPKDVYTNAYVIIQKKLLGSLCKYDFKNDFFCGLTAGSLIIEVYKFVNADKYFLFFPSRNLFLLFDLSKITGIDWSNTLSKKEKIIQELADKNDQMESTAGVMKEYIPVEIKNLLAEHYKKISDINFLHNISSFDIQANILKTMLNTDLM